MRDRRRPAAIPSGEMTPDAIAVLRAIRDDLDADCIYRGTDASAAEGAGLSEHAAGAALHLLSRRGLIRLQRGSGDNAR